MTIPLEQQATYRNRKQGLSQNMMVACGYKYLLLMQEFSRMHLSGDENGTDIF